MSAVFTPSRYKLSIEDYHKLGAAGILDEDSRIELIEGDLIEMAPIGISHMRCVNRLTRLLVSAVGDAAVVSVQNPVTLPPRSEPQPDFALLRPGADNADHVPYPADVLLIVEVADTTLSYDRRTKLPLYARAGIVEVWIVDVQGRTIEAFFSPTESGYVQSALYRKGASISPAQLPAVSIPLDDIFG
jgi:Uma2 family endonuclease